VLTLVEFPTLPPANTIVSGMPDTAANVPIHFFHWQQNSAASFAAHMAPVFS
jgi:hypothetical protein